MAVHELAQRSRELAWAAGLIADGGSPSSLLARIAVSSAVFAAVFLGSAFALRLRALCEISALASPKIESWLPAWSLVSRRLQPTPRPPPTGLLSGRSG